MLQIFTNPNAVWPMEAAVAMGLLGLVSLLSGRREPDWRFFTLGCFCLTGTALCALGLTTARDPGLALLFARLAPAIAFLSLAFAMLYAAMLANLRIERLGMEFSIDVSDGHDRVVLFGRPMRFATYAWIAMGAWTLALVAVARTGWLIRSVHWEPGAGFRIEHGPLVYVAAPMILAALVKLNFFLAIAYRDGGSSHRREFILLNIVGYNLIYGSALILQILLPLLGLSTQFYGFAGFSLAVVVFFTAIIRYQIARVESLNLGLEHQVEQRTSELKEAQLRLVQSEKMASLGQLVAGVAHEINNPIGAVRSMHQSMERATAQLQELVAGSSGQLQDGTRWKRLLGVLRDGNDVVDDGTRRVSEIVKRLKSFAHLDEAQLQDVNVHEGVRDAISLLVHEEMPVVVERQFEKLAPLRCDPGALNQVWLNLMLNALQAMEPQGGTLRIRTYQDADFVHVEVQDDGGGIDAADLSRVFDPGFTTKGVGVGTGLGLAICYQIAQDHGGEIRLESQPGQGTTAAVSLSKHLGTDQLLASTAE